MATAVQKFLAADGTEYNTELEADGHDEALKSKDLIEAYIAASKVQKAQAGALRNQLPKFLAFAKTWTPPAPAADAGGEATA